MQCRSSKSGRASYLSIHAARPLRGLPCHAFAEFQMYYPEMQLPIITVHVLVYTNVAWLYKRLRHIWISCVNVFTRAWKLQTSSCLCKAKLRNSIPQSNNRNCSTDRYQVYPFFGDILYRILSRTHLCIDSCALSRTSVHISIGWLLLLCGHSDNLVTFARW